MAAAAMLAHLQMIGHWSVLDQCTVLERLPVGAVVVLTTEPPPPAPVQAAAGGPWAVPAYARPAITVHLELRSVTGSAAAGTVRAVLRAPSGELVMPFPPTDRVVTGMTAQGASAASVLTASANIPPRPLDTERLPTLATNALMMVQWETATRGELKVPASEGQCVSAGDFAKFRALGNLKLLNDLCARNGAAVGADNAVRSLYRRMAVDLAVWAVHDVAHSHEFTAEITEAVEDKNESPQAVLDRTLRKAKAKKATTKKA